MHKIIKGCLLMLASFSFFAVVGTTTGQAASKTVALPKSYRGTWYLYGGVSMDSANKLPVFTVVRLKLQSKKLNLGVYTTNTPDLKSQAWQLSIASPVTYTKRIKKGHPAVYRVLPRSMEGESLAILGKTKVKVKVLNKRVKALRINLDGDLVYAFRRPLQSHAMDALLD